MCLRKWIERADCWYLFTYYRCSYLFHCSPDCYHWSHASSNIIDTVEAYLYQTYPSSLPAIYIKMPVKVMEACKIPSNVVYRIEKYIYGLLDSGCAYYLAYSTLLVNSGYIHQEQEWPMSFSQVLSGYTRMKLLLLLRVFGYLTVVKSQFKFTVKSDVDLYLGIHFDSS